MLTIKMNTSLNQTNTAQMSNYCILSAPHNHSFSENLLSNNTNYSLFNKDKLEDSGILSAVSSNRHRKSEFNEIEGNSTSSGKDGRSDGLAVLHKSASGDNIDQGNSLKTEQNLLDPYIDAVQVKSRINNKRGPRVKALPSARNHQHQKHQSSPSHQSHHTIQVIKGDYSGKQKEEHDYGDSSDDESDGDEEYNKDDYDDGKKTIYVKEVVSHYLGGSGGHYNKQGAYPQKHGHEHGQVKYGHGGKKRAHRKGGKRKGYHGHGHGHGKKGYGKKGPRTNRKHNHHREGNKHGRYQKTHHKQQKKVTYAYVIQPVVKRIPVVNDKHYGGHDGGHKQHYHGSGGGGYHGDYHGGSAHGKGPYGGGGGGGKAYGYGQKGKQLVQVDMMDKSKLSIAGLLGYTMLCVNYLLLLQQPTYNKYSAGYSKYSPHSGGNGEMVAIKSGGPIILASCGEIPAEKASMAEKSMLQLSSSNSRETSPPATVKLDGLVAAASGQASGFGSAATLPPATYFYTLDPSSKASTLASPPTIAVATNPAASGQLHTTESKLGEMSLSPIQSYVHRLIIPANNDDTPIQVVRGPPARIRLPAAGGPLEGPARRRLTLSTGGGSRGGANSRVGPRARLQIYVGDDGDHDDDDRPQVVRTQNNLLADLAARRRPVPIGMRVVVRRDRGFNSGSLRPLRLLDDERDWMLLAGRGISPLTGQMMTMIQADQPNPARANIIIGASGARNNNTSTTTDSSMGLLAEQQQQQQTPANNNQILDLPDYALSGDSIELTCNHRMPTSRLYSVKWFKDSMEFYRFIPANGARAKSSLFMPDVRLDLGRSNSETLLLRNVTHRTSGLYRCEVVSEGPNFETLSGEKRMQVYTLPESGPRISLLERGAEPAAVSSPAPLLPQLLQTMLPMFTERDPFRLAAWPNSPAAQLQQQQQSFPLMDGPLVRCSSSRSNPAAQLRFFINNRPVDLARTVENSTLSYSDGMEANMASFRLILSDFKLDELVQRGGQARSSGGLEKLATTMKLDAKQPKQTTSQAKSSSNPISRQSLARLTSTTTTSTTTTTPKPLTEAERGKQVNANADVHFDDNDLPVKLEEFKAALEAKKKKQQQQRGGVGADSAIDKKQARKKHKPPSTDATSTTTTTAGDIDDIAGKPDQEEQDDSEAATEQHDELGSGLAAPLPDQRDKTKPNRKSTLVETNIIAVGSPNPLVLEGPVRGSSEAEFVQAPDDNQGSGDGEVLRAKRNHHHHHTVTKATTTSSSTATTKPESRTPAEDGSLSLAGPNNNNNNNNTNNNEEYGEHYGVPNVPITLFDQPNEAQKRRPARQAAAAAAEREQQRAGGLTGGADEAEQVFSSYIRIKCTSLMPAVGYEMASELNIPLTFLVPASQLSDASSRQQQQQQQQQRQLLQQQSQSASQQANGNQDDTLRRHHHQHQQQQWQQSQTSDGATSSNPGAGHAIRNGGSLQAPRAVLIDRVAQGSAPPSKSIAVAAPDGNKQAPSQANNSSATTNSSSTAVVGPSRGAPTGPSSSSKRTQAVSSSSQASSPSPSSSRNRALEQRGKYLEELNKRSKSASNGSSSYLAIMRNLMGGSSRRPRQHGTTATGSQKFLFGLPSLTGLVSYQLTMTLAMAAWLAISRTSAASFKDTRTVAG